MDLFPGLTLNLSNFLEINMADLSQLATRGYPEHHCGGYEYMPDIVRP